MQHGEKREFQVIVIGAGPGGLQLGYYLEKTGIDYLILDRAVDVGSSFERFPVHRKLLSINKIHTGCSDSKKNLRWDWNSLLSDSSLKLSDFDQEYFPNADSLVAYFREFAASEKIRFRANSNVTRVSRSGEKFVVRVEQAGEYTCELLVMATGLSIANIPNVPGIELAEHYATHDLSADASRNKDILILGKGNSAFETATNFLPHAARVHLLSPNYLRWAWRSHYPGDLRQINSPFFETFPLKQQNAVLSGTVLRIERLGQKYAVDIEWTENGHRSQFLYDRIIACTGFRFDSSLFADDIVPSLAHGEKLPALTCQWESRNVGGLYFCGTLMQSVDYRKSSSAFLHGMRYNATILSRLLEARLRGTTISGMRVAPDADLICNQIFERIRASSSLWHLYDFLCDAFVFDEAEGTFERFEDVSVKMMREDPTFKDSSRIEFRFTFENPAEAPEKEKFSNIGLLHPVLHFYVRGESLGSCHMYEDVYAEWAQKDFGFCFRPRITDFVEILAARGLSEIAAPASVLATRAVR
jgi:thioredoxin reductase